MTPDVSLIISFYNRSDLLRCIFAALERQEYKHFEVIIADDGSNQQVVEEVQALIKKAVFPVKHLWQEDTGWRKNKILNQAVLASSTDYLVFLDGDCIPHKKFILEHLENRKQGTLISGRRVLLTKELSEKITPERIAEGFIEKNILLPLLLETIKGTKTYFLHGIRLRNKTLRRWFIKDKVRNILGCNFSAWKQDILDVNGFDERYEHAGIGEDNDLDFRLREKEIYPISKKHLVTVYHCWHQHQDTNYAPNIQMWEEKKARHETWTPYGILKSEQAQ